MLEEAGLKSSSGLWPVLVSQNIQWGYFWILWMFWSFSTTLKDWDLFGFSLSLKDRLSVSVHTKETSTNLCLSVIQLFRRIAPMPPTPMFRPVLSVSVANLGQWAHFTHMHTPLSSSPQYSDFTLVSKERLIHAHQVHWLEGVLWPVHIQWTGLEEQPFSD